MSAGSQDIDVAEHAAVTALRPELWEHLQLADMAFNLVGLAVSLAPAVPQSQLRPSRSVSTCLLVRLSNDIRCAMKLAIQGYPLQTASLIASVYEVAYTIAAIGSDDALAGEWIDHSTPAKLFRKVEDLTRIGLQRLGVGDLDSETKNAYRQYRQLCLAKHSNPLLQRQHGHKITEDEILVVNGPDESEQGTRVSWFALERAGHLAYIALASFLDNHIPPVVRARMAVPVNEMGARREQLARKAVERWGNDDPFPGCW